MEATSTAWNATSFFKKSQQLLENNDKIVNDGKYTPHEPISIAILTLKVPT